MKRRILFLIGVGLCYGPVFIFNGYSKDAKLFFPEEFPDIIADEARRLWGSR